MKVCDMIIDSRKGENVVFKSLAKAMGLATEKHPKPYNIGWIKKGVEINVIEVRQIPLSIEKHYQIRSFVMY